MDMFRALLPWFVHMKARFHACTVPRSGTWGGPGAHGVRPGAAEPEASSWQGLSAGSTRVCPSLGCICPRGLAVLFGSSSTSQCACTMGPGHFSPLCPFSQHCIALQCFPGIYQGPSFPCSFLSYVHFSRGSPFLSPPALTPPAEGWGARGPRCRAPAPSSCGFRSGAVPRLV